MEVSEAFAHQVLRELQGVADGEEPAIDPATVMLIISIISQVLEECRKRRNFSAARALQTARSPGVLSRVKAVRIAMEHELGWRQARQVVDAIVSAAVKAEDGAAAKFIAEYDAA